MQHQRLRCSLVAIALLALVQCGDEKTIGSLVELEILPKRPVVIESDFTMNAGSDNEKKIVGPWFAVNFRVTNNSDRYVTIQSLLFTVTAFTSTGALQTKKVPIDPADFENFFVPPRPESELYYLEEIAPGTTLQAPYTLFVDGLEKNVSSFSYSVTVDVQGWVGEAGKPEDRLNKAVTFTTQ